MSDEEFNRRIPKQKFYENMDISPALKKIFVEQVKQCEILDDFILYLGQKTVNFKLDGVGQRRHHFVEKGIDAIGVCLIAIKQTVVQLTIIPKMIFVILIR